jgi:hypothetical protein
MADGIESVIDTCSAFDPVTLSLKGALNGVPTRRVVIRDKNCLHRISLRAAVHSAFLSP